jgi:murein DD-endopeptidase MepM/ murein hydrolase activator NlpD
LRWGLALVAACALATASPAAAGFPGGGAVLGHAPGAEAEAFTVPLRGPLESRFGYRWGRLHAGLDIAVLRTSRVHAAADGVVVAVGWLPEHSGYGNVVKIRHRPGFVTMYAHLSSARVRVGELVTRGEWIAAAGCTGSCTGPHLHFEVHLRGRPVDPLPYLRGRLR